MNRCVSRRSLATVARLVTTNVTRSTFTNIVHHQPVFAPCLNLSINRNFSSDSPNPVHEKIDGFVKNAKVVVFMKGVPSAPQCGFSNAVVQILRFVFLLIDYYLFHCDIFCRMHDVNYESHNVLADEDIRQGIKDYSNWPTIPQVQ